MDGDVGLWNIQYLEAHVGDAIGFIVVLVTCNKIIVLMSYVLLCHPAEISLQFYSLR